MITPRFVNLKYYRQRDTFWTHHLLAFVFVLTSALIVVEIFDIDLIVSDFLYDYQGGTWALKNNFITSVLLHDYAQKLSQGIALLVLVIAFTSRFVDCLMPYKRGLWVIFLSLVFSASIVSVLKEITNVHCPWDLRRYGGLHEFLPNYSFNRNDSAQGRCFPSGHASGGYGFMVLYFVFLHYRPKWKWLGLACGVILGLIYGITQQLRGAHFLSHDLWTIVVCWLTALLFYTILLRHRTSTPLNH